MSEKPINILSDLEDECETARAISQILLLLCCTADGNPDITLPDIKDTLWLFGDAAEEHARNLKALTDNFSEIYTQKI